MRDVVNNIEKRCASALLDAWRRDDSALMSELADFASLETRELHVSDPGRSERLELLSAIAVTLRRASLSARKEEADPYVRLLVHLAKPDHPGRGPAHSN